jgi:hypothetical protein
MNKKILFSFLLSLFLLHASAQVVRLYEDCYFGGRSVTLSPGKYTGFQHGLRIRELSSIEIPVGLTVNLFSKDYFTGHYISLTGTTACLVDQHFNDMMVSIQIIDDRYNMANNAPVKIFNRCNYQGTAEQLYEGTYQQLSFGFASMQSVQVAPAMQLYFEKEMRIGNSVSVKNEEIRGDKNCLGLFWGTTVKQAYVYKLDNIYDDYWNSTPTHINTFNQGAVAYADINFRGRAQMLNIGAYRGYQLTRGGCTQYVFNKHFCWL